MSEVSHVPYVSSVDGAVGYQITLPAPEYIGTGNAIVIAVGNATRGNRIYAETLSTSIRNDLCLEDRSRASEELEEAALRYLVENRFDEAFSTWADKVLATSENLWSQFENNNFGETELHIGGEFFCVVAPCYEVGKTDVRKADIEYYLIVNDNNNEISGGKSIYALANQYVNKELLHKSRISEQEELQRFYDENIYSIRNIPISTMTTEQKKLNEMYSEWHKDLYGHRPHSKSLDVCFQNHNNNNSGKKEEAQCLCS